MEKKELKENKITPGTIARTIILVLALVNQILTLSGHSILPFTDQFITELVSMIWTVVISIITWWKNNSFTKEAIAADKIMHAVKTDNKNSK